MHAIFRFPALLTIGFALTFPFLAKADWINLTGAETAPNIAEIYILDDHVKLVLEAYIGDLKTFEELIPDEWLKDLDGHQLDSINDLPVATRQWSKAIISTHGM